LGRSRRAELPRIPRSGNDCAAAAKTSGRMPRAARVNPVRLYAAVKPMFNFTTRMVRRGGAPTPRLVLLHYTDLVLGQETGAILHVQSLRHRRGSSFVVSGEQFDLPDAERPDGGERGRDLRPQRFTVGEGPR